MPHVREQHDPKDQRCPFCRHRVKFGAAAIREEQVEDRTWHYGCAQRCLAYWQPPEDAEEEENAA